MNEKHRFIIYADGGAATCMGHIMRTVTLADAMSKIGIEILFVTSSIEVIDYIENSGYKVYLTEQLDYEFLGRYAIEKNVSGIMVDKFGFTNEQHQILVDKVGLLVHIDDFLYDGPAQIVINSTIDEIPPNRDNIWLCGGKYAVIRQKFVNENKIIKEYPEDILITTGYADPGNVHLKIIEIIERILPKVNLRVVIGGGYNTGKSLDDISYHNEHVKLYRNLNDLSDLMKICDMAITAAGTTLYELAAAGVPTIAFSLYDNQIDNLERCKIKGSIKSVGWYKDIDFIELENAIFELYNDTESRKIISKNGRDWIDGKGALRCANIILEAMKINEKKKDCNRYN